MIPLLLPPASTAPPVTRALFAYWVGGSGAPVPPAPVGPPKGSYWHVAYWPDAASTPKKPRRKR